MKLPNELIELMEGSEHRALATVGEDGPNVVPVSMVRFEDDHIVICDCFMGRSAGNIALDDRVAVAFWKGFAGMQVKGRVEYLQAGEVFDRAAMRLKETHPDRVLKGVLIMKPEAVYDLSPLNAGVKLA